MANPFRVTRRTYTRADVAHYGGPEFTGKSVARELFARFAFVETVEVVEEDYGRIAFLLYPAPSYPDILEAAELADCYAPAHCVAPVAGVDAP